MLPSRVTVHLNPREINALLELAQREYREPRAQAAILIREALEQRGLLSPDEPRISGKDHQSKVTKDESCVG